MTDGQKLDRQREPEVLSPADAAMVARLRDFGDVAVRPFDAPGIVALATAGPSSGRVRLGRTLRLPTLPTRSAWVFISVLLVVVLATILVLVGSSRVRPSIVETPPVLPTVVPSQLAVGPIETVGPSSSPAVPGPAVLGPGRIAYAVDGDVYVADIAGTGARKILTGGSAPYDDPQWAADGRISVTRSAGNDQTSALDILLTDAKGARPRKVGHVDPGQGNRYHRWSPDGTRLAILDRTAITILGDGPTITLSPPTGRRWDVSDVVTFSWAPDGTALLAGACVPQGEYCDKAATMSLMLVPIDGSAPRELAPVEDSAWAATFSPDGSRIAFVGSVSAGFQLYVMDADGTHRRVIVPPVTTGSWTYGLTYVWSPDGRSIAFHHSVDDGNGADLTGGKGLWIKDVDSDAPPRLFAPDVPVFGVHAWSPDGRWLLVSGFHGDTSDLSAVDVATGAETVIARGPQDGDWTWDAASPAPSPSSAPSASASPAASANAPVGSSGAALVYLRGSDVIASGLDGSGPRIMASNARVPSNADDVLDFDALALSPDGQAVAYLGADGVDVVSVTGHHIGSIPSGAKVRGDRVAMTWAPDSGRLAIYRDGDPGRLAIFGSDGREVGSIDLPAGFVAGRLSVPQFSWAPDGRSIAISGCVDLCAGGPGQASMDEILLVAADGSGSHWLNDRTVRLDPLPMGGTDAWADWSLDSRLAVSRECRPDDVWCSEGSYPALQITGPDGIAGDQVKLNAIVPGLVAWSPDGRRIAMASWGPGGPSLVIAEPDGSFTEVGAISGVPGPGEIHWAPDGQSILISGGGSLWSVPLTGAGPASEIVQNVEEWFAVAPAS